MKKLATLFLACLFSASLFSPASAEIVLYGSRMSGGQVAIPTTSPGTGEVRIFHDTVLDTIRVVVTFSGLQGTTTAGTLNGPTSIGGLSTARPVTLPSGILGFPVGVTSGSYDRTFSLSSASTYRSGYLFESGGSTDAERLANARSRVLTGLRNGTMYFQIITSRFPSSEIRGFLAVGVPEPSSIALLGGFAVVSGWRLARRKRSQVQV